ncbi:MAG: hypothetical protein K1X67_04190 [Fimbriimonadaceae bacterium]|nr:hypothetical protein [Fimbriimonadaceae bacterium]
MDKETRDRVRRLMGEVDQILWDEWDPIGVNDEPLARSEYSAYVGPVVSLLLRNADANEIAAHLEQIEKVMMECDRGDEVRRKVVERLKSISLA